MNAYVRITSMGCSISVICIEWLALWTQAAIYFTTSCPMYRRYIFKMMKSPIIQGVQNK